MAAGRHGRSSSMVIRSGFGLRIQGPSGLTGRPADVQQAIKDEQRKEYNELAPRIIAAYEVRVGNWSDETKPTFVKVVRDGGKNKKMSLFIQARGTDHQKLTFAMIDSKGRKSGRIFSPKRRMKFKKNYFSKTAATDIYGRRVRRSGATTLAWFVDHPGIEPRGFSEAILEEFHDDFFRAAKRGMKKGIKKTTKVVG